MAIAVVIANIDRSSYLDHAESGKGGQTRYSTATGQRGTATVSLRTHPGDTYAPLVGNPISLYDQAGHRVFGGIITGIVKTNEGNTQEISYVCTCASFERMLDKHRITPASYFNQTADYIFKAIFNSLPGETITLGQVDAGPVIASAVYRHEVVTDVFNNLATEANFIWGVDPATEQLYFRSPTSVNAPFDLTGNPATGAGALFDTVQWDTAQQDFRSRQYITVNLQPSMLDTDLITGDGTTTTFTLSHPADTVAAVTILGGAATSVGTSTAADLNTAFINVTSVIYHLVKTFDGTSGEIQVLLSGYLSTTLQNLADAINGAPKTGSNYQVNSGAPVPPNPKVTASLNGNNITVTAIISGTSGNSLEVGDWLATTSYLTWSGPSAGGVLVYLSGGSDGPTRATVDGVFNAVVSNNETATIDGITYKFVTQLDNTIPHQVLIGSNADTCAVNLVEAISGAPHPAAGNDFSLPTVPHPTCVASFGGGGTGKVSLFAKTPGSQGNAIAVSANSLYFFWGAPNLSGGIDGPTIAGTIGTGGTGQDWAYVEGANIVTSTTPLPAGVIAAVSYYRLGVDIIGVENTALAQTRAAVEGGSGIYQALIDVSSTTDPVANNPTAAISSANSLLTNYGLLTQTLTFYTDSAGWQPGQALKVNMAPPFDSTLNGTWLTSQIDGAYIPGMAGWRCQVQAIAMSLNGRAASADMRANTPVVIPRKATWQMLWQRLATINPRRQKPGGGILGSANILAGGGTPPNGGGGGGTGGAIAPPVTITGNTITARNNQQEEVQVTYTLSPSANAQNFSGVAIYLEDPDISSQPAVKLDGTSRLDAGSQTSARWIPVFENDNYSTWSGSTETHTPADILIDNSVPFRNRGMGRNIRVYLASFGPNSNATLVRANQTNPTPSVVIAIPPPKTQYVRGEEYAWLVTNVQVQLETDFNRPDPNYRLEYSYTPPDPNISVPPGMQPFGGCEIFFTYPDAKGTDPLYVITDSGVFVPQTASNGYLSPTYNPGGGGTFRVYFCSGDNSQPAQVNSLIPGVTPYQEVTITYPPTDSGGNTLPTTPDISGLVLSNPRMVWQPDGSMLAEIDVSWTNPTTANYAGLEFYVTATNPVDANYKLPLQLADLGNNVTSGTFAVLNWPKTTEQWTITAISLDSNGRQNNDPNHPRGTSIQAIWTIGPPGPGGTGQESAPLVTPLQLPTPTVDQQVSNDGVQMMRFKLSGWTDPNDNKFGGVKIAMVDNDGTVYWDAGKATTFTTPWLPAVTAQRIYFYWVSYNPQNQQNSIVPQPGGQTPYTFVDFTPSPGQIKASQIPTNWFSTNDFAWPNAPGAFDPAHPTTTGLLVKQIAAGRVFVGDILRVGGAPVGSGYDSSFVGSSNGLNGQIAVYSSGGDPGDISGKPTLRAWMGQQSTQLPDKSFGTVYGGWFAALYVGGTGPPTAPLYVNNGGIVTVGGWDVQAVNNQTYFPYISVRNKYNVEQGRIGAVLAANSDGSRIVPPGDIADIGGAWFNEFACGGANLANWRFLCPGDNTIRIRNINTFEIDYSANVAPVPPYNAPYKLLLGTDIAYTAIGQNKFPGITLMRQGTPNNTHGITIINRGIILGADDPFVAQKQRAALVTFNGDSQGGDGSPFWGELVMFSPTTGNQNVTFNSGNKVSGSLIGSPELTMLDDAGNLHFQVRNSGDVVIGNQLFWGPTASLQLIDQYGNYIGPMKAGDFSANSYSIGATKVIDSSRNLVNSNVNIGANYWIDSGQITASSLYIRVGGVATPIINGFGQWVGPAMTGAQTPWTQTIYAQGNELHDAGRIVAQLSTYVLRNSPNAGFGEHVLDLTGPGILLMSAGGGYPRMDLQPSSISMLNSGATQVFHVDLNGVLTCSSNSVWTGSVNTGTNFVYATQFGIWGYAVGVGTTATPVTFPTNDGRTVTVVGGIITKVQ
jgi:hypothetical protein